MNVINTTSLRCTNCQTGSFGEYIIRNTLRFNHIPFEFEVIVKHGDKKYRLDFLIEDRVALEYSGMQHFEKGLYYSTAVNAGVIVKQQWALSHGYEFYELTAKRTMTDIVESLAVALNQQLDTPTPEFFASSRESLKVVLNYMYTHSARATSRDLEVSISAIKHYVQLAGYESISAWQAENKRA